VCDTLKTYDTTLDDKFYKWCINTREVYTTEKGLIRAAGHYNSNSKTIWPENFKIVNGVDPTSDPWEKPRLDKLKLLEGRGEFILALKRLFYNYFYYC
jgi:hypothetical protein